MSQLPDTAEGYKYLKHEYEMRLGRMNLENYKRNYVAKDKIKAKIEEINNEKLNYSENEYYLENEIKGYTIDKIQELLEE